MYKCTSRHINTDVQSLSTTSTALVPGLVTITEEEFSEERETVNVLIESCSTTELSWMVNVNVNVSMCTSVHLGT